jgi:hypothetical protein
MPTAGSPPELLVDTSVAVALSVADHERHQAVSRALHGRSLGLAGHAAFETLSVLTRLPPPARRSPATIGSLLDPSFPVSRFLGTHATASLLDELGRVGIAGDAVRRPGGGVRERARASAGHLRPSRARDLPSVERSRRVARLTA